MEHLSESLIRRFARSEASRAENRAVVRHLLAGCPACAEELRAQLFPPVRPDAYDSVLCHWIPLFQEALSRSPARPRPSLLQ
jgi:hypothetical protein